MRYKEKQNTPDIWFAWYPVKNDCDVWVWLEDLNRIPIFANAGFMYYHYRDIIKDK